MEAVDLRRRRPGRAWRGTAEVRQRDAGGEEPDEQSDRERPRRDPGRDEDDDGSDRQFETDAPAPTQRARVAICQW